MRSIIKNCLKMLLFKIAFVRSIYFLGGVKLYPKYNRSEQNQSLMKFLIKNGRQLYLCEERKDKSEQIRDLLDRVNIHPVYNKSFFYCIDCFKSLKTDKPILGNTTVDYDVIVNGTLLSIWNFLKGGNSKFDRDELIVLDSLHAYLERCKKEDEFQLSKKFDAVESIFVRPSETFFEGLQRILFFNQFLWQTRHTLNGID